MSSFHERRRSCSAIFANRADTLLFVLVAHEVNALAERLFLYGTKPRQNTTEKPCLDMQYFSCGNIFAATKYANYQTINFLFLTV